MTPEIQELEQQIEKLKELLADARRKAPREEVNNFEFATTDGPRKLIDLFRGKEDLLVVHNMGRSCPYCTLWADGLNGHTKHYEKRTSFVVCSPDSVDIQREFSECRGWSFAMVSDQTKEFSTAMGYWSETDGWWPGVSAFVLENGKIYRTGKAAFGPGDDFCGIWPMMDLLGGPNGWEPEINI